MAHRANRIIRVVIIIIIALAASFLGYMLMNNFQFSKGVSILVHFPSVGDLNVGAWVRKSGIKVGSVTKLEIAADETTVMATVRFIPGQTVREADKFALVAKGILGDMYIEQRPGPADSPLAEERRLYEGEPSFNITDLLGGSTMNTVTDLAASLKKVLATLEANAGALDSSLKDIAASAKNVRIVTDRAVAITESVPQITRQITTSIDSLQASVADVAATTKKVLAGLETNLKKSGDDLSASLEAIRRSSMEVQAAVEQLTAKDSVIAGLSDPATAESMKTTVKNLETISRQLLTVSQDTGKIVKGVSAIFETK